MIKVLHFVTVMDRAGQETFIMNVYRAADKSKYRFNFLCDTHRKGDYDDEINELGGGIFYLPERKNNHGFKRYKEEISLLKGWLISNKEEYDCVHLHTHHALDVWAHLEACRQAKVKNIIIHSHSTTGENIGLHKIARIFNNVFYRFNKLACSKDAGDWLFGKSQRNNVSVIYNGIDINEFKYSENNRNKIRKEFNLADKTVIGHVGRFTKLKNHTFLLDVFSSYHQINPNSVLMLVGKGELEEEIQKRVKELNLEDSVIFTGTRDDVGALLSAFDIFVFPSIFEGLGIVLIEAQVNGLSVITNSNIPKEAIISDSVTLLPIKSVENWANCINMLSEKRTNNIDYDKFNVKNTSKQILDIYDKVVDKGKCNE